MWGVKKLKQVTILMHRKFLGWIPPLIIAQNWKKYSQIFPMKYYETRFSSSPDELCVESTPSLAFSSLPWPFHHPVLMNQLCQPVSTAITQHITVQEDQLALRPVEPVVVGICNGYGPLKSWWDSETTERTTSVVAVHKGVMKKYLIS